MHEMFSIYADFSLFCDNTFWSIMVNTILKVWIVKSDNDWHIYRVFFRIDISGPQHVLVFFFYKNIDVMV